MAKSTAALALALTASTNPAPAALNGPNRPDAALPSPAPTSINVFAAAPAKSMFVAIMVAAACMGFSAI